MHPPAICTTCTRAGAGRKPCPPGAGAFGRTPRTRGRGLALYRTRPGLGLLHPGPSSAPGGPRPSAPGSFDGPRGPRPSAHRPGRGTYPCRPPGPSPGTCYPGDPGQVLHRPPGTSPARGPLPPGTPTHPGPPGTPAHPGPSPAPGGPRPSTAPGPRPSAHRPPGA